MRTISSLPYLAALLVFLTLVAATPVPAGESEAEEWRYISLNDSPAGSNGQNTVSSARQPARTFGEMTYEAIPPAISHQSQPVDNAWDKMMIFLFGVCDATELFCSGKCKQVHCPDRCCGDSCSGLFKRRTLSRLCDGCKDATKCCCKICDGDGDCCCCNCDCDGDCSID